MLGLIVHYCRNTAQVGKGGKGLILHLIPGAGQAIGHGELLRDTEQEKEYRSRWKIIGVQRSLCFMNRAEPSMTGNYVTNTLKASVQIIIIDKREYI